MIIYCHGGAYDMQTLDLDTDQARPTITLTNGQTYTLNTDDQGQPIIDWAGRPQYRYSPPIQTTSGKQLDAMQRAAQDQQRFDRS